MDNWMILNSIQSDFIVSPILTFEFSVSISQKYFTWTHFSKIHNFFKTKTNKTQVTLCGQTKELDWSKTVRRPVIASSSRENPLPDDIFSSLDFYFIQSYFLTLIYVKPDESWINLYTGFISTVYRRKRCHVIIYMRGAKRWPVSWEGGFGTSCEQTGVDNIAVTKICYARNVPVPLKEKTVLRLRICIRQNSDWS